MRSGIRRSVRGRRLIPLLALAVSLPLLAGYALLEPRWLKIRKIDFIHRDIPQAFDGKTIVFLTDIHHGPFFSRERVAGLVRTVNRLAPDLVLLGGDYVHRDPKYIVPCFQELGKLEAPLGIFGVLGNHDHWEDASLTRKCMAEAGITLVENQCEWFHLNGHRIAVGGVGDLWEDAQDLEAATAGAAAADFVILLSHNPDYAEQVTGDRVDLVLSGHTHGGQVAVFGLWAPAVPSRYGQKYRAGMVDTGYASVFVSTGVGTITPPVRFCARPEIVLITLKNR